MSKPKFYKAELKEVKGNVLDLVYPQHKNNQLTMAERMGTEDANCPDCGKNHWWLFPDECALIKEGGKPYIECLECGFQTHL